MKNQNIEPANFFKSMSLVFMALLAGMVIMGSMIYIMNPSKNFEFNLKERQLVIMLISMIAGFFGSNLLYNLFKNKINSNDSVAEKMTKIQSANIVRLALVEGPALLGIIFYLVGSNLAFLMLSAVMILYFLTLKPSKDKILDDMNLTSDERKQF